MTRKSLFTHLMIGFVGFVGGALFWYLASPLFIDRVVDESLSESAKTRVLSTGSFQDVDSIHKGSGTATIYEGADGRRTLRLTDFEVTNGPDLKVWLVEKKDVQESSDVTDMPYVSLGVLKGNIGSQNYQIPADVDLSKYGSVVIWCEQFSQLFSPATLEMPVAGA